MISEERLNEWQRLADEATEGPWLKYEEAKAKYKEYTYYFDWWQIIAQNKATKMPFVLCSSNGCLTSRDEREKAYGTGEEPEGQTKKDMAFIAAAREAVPELIEEVRRLQDELAAEHEDRAHFAECHYIEQQKNFTLEKEADWLAERLEETGSCCVPRKVKSASSWREAARKAVGGK